MDVQEIWQVVTICIILLCDKCLSDDEVSSTSDDLMRERSLADNEQTGEIPTSNQWEDEFGSAAFPYEASSSSVFSSSSAASAAAASSSPAFRQSDEQEFSMNTSEFNISEIFVSLTLRDVPSAEYVNGSSSSDDIKGKLPDYMRLCPSGLQCSEMSGECIECNQSSSCMYGRNVSSSCWARESVGCLGPRNFTRWYTCQYCYQTPHWLHTCTNDTTCKVLTAPRQMYIANCSVREDVICLGQRRFHKKLACNWTSGKRWSVALILSVTLGGFGADRYYLGLWKEGIGKLFSFGGLGVWTLVDVVLVATGYIGPADGSLYIF